MGRHDPCMPPRAVPCGAVPMVEAMVALVLADHLLRQKGSAVCGERGGAHRCLTTGGADGHSGGLDGASPSGGASWSSMEWNVPSEG